MGKIINRKVSIDEETGEIIDEKGWIGYDGFTNKGYQYRRRESCIRYFFDSLPDNLSEASWILLMMIAEIMNEENLLVYRVKRKSKFSTIIYKPYDKDEIAERVRFKYGKNKFDKCWRELCKHCIKRIKYQDFMVWAVNPAVVSRCRTTPYWLCEEFISYMAPHLSAKTLTKLELRIKNQEQ